MKVEFELTLDSNGRPCISFKSNYKDYSLEQKVLRVFLDAIKEKGINLVSTGINVVNFSEGYEIQIGNNLIDDFDRAGKAIEYVRRAYRGRSTSTKGQSFMLIGDVRELIKITTGKEVDLDLLIGK